MPKRKNSRNESAAVDLASLSSDEAEGPAPAVTDFLECPAQLPPLAREEWNRIVGELTALNVLSKFDRSALAVYCGAYAIWADSTQALQQFGTMIKSPNGHPVQSPYMSIVNKQAEIMLRIATEFGFTPASRSRNFSYSKGSSMLLEAPEKSIFELPPLY